MSARIVPEEGRAAHVPAPSTGTSGAGGSPASSPGAPASDVGVGGSGSGNSATRREVGEVVVYEGEWQSGLPHGIGVHFFGNGDM